jgi:hypothetical protein
MGSEGALQERQIDDRSQQQQFPQDRQIQPSIGERFALASFQFKLSMTPPRILTI